MFESSVVIYGHFYKLYFVSAHSLHCPHYNLMLGRGSLILLCISSSGHIESSPDLSDLTTTQSFALSTNNQFLVYLSSLLVVYLSSLLCAVIALHALVDNKATIEWMELEDESAKEPGKKKTAIKKDDSKGAQMLFLLCCFCSQAQTSVLGKLAI